MACVTASTVRPCASSPYEKMEAEGYGYLLYLFENDFRCIHIKRKKA